MNMVLLRAMLPWVGMVYFAHVNWCRSGAWPRLQGLVVAHQARGAEQPNDLLVAAAFACARGGVPTRPGVRRANG